MTRKELDGAGVAMLVGFSVLMGLNQVSIKIVNGGLGPVFFAGLRSAGAVLCLGLLFLAWRRPPQITRDTILPGLAIGGLFALEFLLLFQALDLTSVTRSVVIFYTMPVWMALGGHLLLPGERLNLSRLAGLGLGLAGVAWVIADRDGGQAPSLLGDLYALGAALCWAGLALVARGSRLSRVGAETQLMWQLGVSAVLLLAVAPLFGPLLRTPTWVTWAGLGFQIGVVATLGFLLWLWLLSVYPPGSVAAFGFLSPVFGVALGALVLGEPVGLSVLGALGLVSAGLWLVTRPQVPQKVA